MRAVKDVQRPLWMQEVKEPVALDELELYLKEVASEIQDTELLHACAWQDQLLKFPRTELGKNGDINTGYVFNDVNGVMARVSKEPSKDSCILFAQVPFSANFCQLS